MNHGAISIPDQIHHRDAARLLCKAIKTSEPQADKLLLKAAEQLLRHTILLLRIARKTQTNGKDQPVTLSQICDLFYANAYRSKLKLAQSYLIRAKQRSNTRSSLTSDATAEHIGCAAMKTYFEGQWLKLPRNHQMQVVVILELFNRTSTLSFGAQSPGNQMPSRPLAKAA